MKRSSIYWIPLLALLVAAGCKDRGKDVLEYDRSALTAQLADAVILPAYASLNSAAQVLLGSQAAFRAQPDAAHLDSLQSAFAAAWLAWKPCSPFEFGPAATVTLRAALNTFPTDSTQIKTNVTAGTWDLNTAANLDARGFPALDYLLHGLAPDDAGILARYAQPADSARLQAYLAAVVSDITGLVGTVHSQWQGGYAATFKASLGTDVGSSTSLLVNELNRDLEIIKTASIGIPIGKQTFGQVLPEKVEGYFSGLSEQLAVAELGGIEAVYLGRAANGSDGYGIAEALDALEAEYNAQPLTQAIGAQFGAARNALQAMGDPLSDAVTTAPAGVEAAYTELQKLVILLKTDAASALSILITYTDADGD